MEQDKKKMANDRNADSKYEDGLTEVCMTGGPPWGFNISGGSEFGTDVFIKKVAEDGIARKVGGLREGDSLVYINDVRCTSRSKAIDLVKTGNNQLKLKIRRNQSADGEMRTFETRSGPKRSGSFYESVVENMLENVSNDISSTQYSIRRSTFGNEKGIARKKKDELKEETKQEIEKMEGKQPVEANSPAKVEQKEALQPGNDQLAIGQVSPRNVQRVKIKSVNVTSMKPIVKNDISHQIRGKTESADSKYFPLRPTTIAGDSSGVPTTKVGLVKEKENFRQTRSTEDEEPAAYQSSNTVMGLRKNNNAPPVASRSFKPLSHSPESGNESPVMSVSKARAMFEELSKSQENLDMIGTKHSPRGSPKPEMAPARTNRSEDQVVRRRESPPSNSSNHPPVKATHSYTKSLPLENMEFVKRDTRRPGSAPNRRSDRKIRAKSAHFPSEQELMEAQDLPLGYGEIPAATNRVVHGRKSIASCAPTATALYKKESFRHSSEDLRPQGPVPKWAKKSATLPANQMREAAKRFHKELMKKDPKFRYSLSTVEPLVRPGHLGTYTGGSSGSSIGSSQDHLNAVESTRRSSGPSAFNRACSTSSLDSSPGHQEQLPSPADEDGDSILSRLLREQRLSNNGNLNRIEEEARSPRRKASPRAGMLTSSQSVETESHSVSGKRTISIQTNFVADTQKKTDVFENRPLSSENPRSYSSTIQTHSAVETCIDDVDPTYASPVSPKRKESASPSEDSTSTVDLVSHEKEPSTDSVKELTEINEAKERENTETKENVEDFPLPDIDALPPPPDELLIGSPPEKEKPLRVINRKKRDQHSTIGSSRNSSCVSTDSNISTSTMDSGIGVRGCSMSDMSPRNSPTRVTSSEFDDYYKEAVIDEGFKGSRDALDENEYPAADRFPTTDQSRAMTPPDDLETPNEQSKEYEISDTDRSLSSPTLDTPGSSRGGSRPDSLIIMSPRIEELDQEKASLIDSMRRKIEELKSQEQEIADEIKLNEDLGKRVRGLIERKATQTEFSKYELFIGELNKIVALLLSLTQRLHRYEQMLQDLDMSEEEDKQKKDTLTSKIDKLRNQHEEACHLREVNDKRGENVANFLDKYFNEEEFADFTYYVDMKSQLALMQSEIKEKVKLGEERFQALDRTGTEWNSDK